ncbi:MAG: tRNA glutamyl-Q(34) synthetase GluQRS [Cellvibrionaceae bacterium]
MSTPLSSSSPYIGRFAPSPTGELHQGSLLTAVASYLDARQVQGQWLVRMEDLDPPREQAGAADSILRALETHGLHWDQKVIYQSQRQNAYNERLAELKAKQLCYPCDCNRQRLKNLPAYDGHCRHHVPQRSQPVATRVKLKPGSEIRFEDVFQGHQTQHLNREVGDFVIHRKDGLFAYQLAVTVDDIDQGITQVIRGIDLMSSTARQLYLFEQFGAPQPSYGHLPVIVNSQGQKLSKQTFAEPLSNAQASDNLWLALARLGLAPPPNLQKEDCETQLNWGVINWQRSKVPRTTKIELDQTPMPD